MNARNETYNAAVPDGATVNFGFLAESSGANPRPTEFRFNGTVCTIE